MRQGRFKFNIFINFTPNQKHQWDYLHIFRQQNRTVISNSDIKLRKISSFPGPFSLPLLSTRISQSQNTQKRYQKVLIQRVPNKPNILISHHFQEFSRVDLGQNTAFGHPCPRIDPTHVSPLVSNAVPGVSVKWAGLIVHGLPIGISYPLAFEEVTWGCWQI